MYFSFVFVCVSTFLWTGVWVQAGGPSEGCRSVLPGATLGSWCPVNRISCAEAPAPSLRPSHSQLDRNLLAPATPLDKNLSGRGGDDSEDGGWGLWPRHLDQALRGHGWAGTTGVSEVSSWLRLLTEALANLLLFSPSKNGDRSRRGWKHKGMEEQGSKCTERERDYSFSRSYMLSIFSFYITSCCFYILLCVWIKETRSPNVSELQMHL